MFKKMIGIMTLAVSLIVSSAVFAADSWCREGLQTMVKSLNIDSTQKDKIQPILDQFKSNLQQAKAQMKDVSDKLEQQFSSDSMDQSQMNSLIDQKSKIIGDMMKAKMDAKMQIMAVLNPTQKAKFQDMMKKAHEKMEARFKNCKDDD